ncbi:MauE/DoxX family redox-associated membrane protein [Micromonospora sp. NPDC005174]|uniref:MauE/DoxX family redox-associated membrane protein n=1 Tax=Micromonospora sp. NPDC005174 TaxID=3157018 RepID=UPI0033A8FB1E
MSEAAVLGVRILVAALFLHAGGAKLFAPQQFSRTLRATLRIDDSHSLWTDNSARAIAFGEIVTALLLVGLPDDAYGLVLSALLGAGIAAFALMARLRRVTMACGCFGGSQGRPLGMRQLLFGTVLLAVSALLAYGQTDTRADNAALIVAACIGALVANLIRWRANLVQPLRRHLQPFPQ